MESPMLPIRTCPDLTWCRAQPRISLMAVIPGHQAAQAEQGMLIHKFFVILQKGRAPVVGQAFHSALNKQYKSRQDDPGISQKFAGLFDWKSLGTVWEAGNLTNRKKMVDRNTKMPIQNRILS